MFNDFSGNRIVLRGVCTKDPTLSHYIRTERCYAFPLSARRLSGVCDNVNVIYRERLCSAFRPAVGMELYVSGEVRTYNNKSGVGSRLIIYVLAKCICNDSGPAENKVCLTGTVCKPPILRETPLGREICDFMLAVARPYGKSDYIPCITWGDTARRASRLVTGDEVNLEGRLQSRMYMKYENGSMLEKTAFEVSVSQFFPSP